MCSVLQVVMQIMQHLWTVGSVLQSTVSVCFCSSTCYICFLYTLSLYCY